METAIKLSKIEKQLLKTLKEGINNTVNAKEVTDGQT